jgi:hypothetical protein
MARRPPTIAISDLSKAVEQAVKVATEKHKVQFLAEFRIGPGTIIGRQLLTADIGLKQAEQIATEIAEHVTTKVESAAAIAANQFEPAVLIKGGGTTCGMICGPRVELQ